MMKSNIVNPGSKFVVSPKTEDTTLGPGTTGFISFVMGRDRDYSNVVHYRTIITRRGKAGKERLESFDLSTPIFDLGDDSIHRIMPDEKRKNYVHLEIEPKQGNLLEFKDIDFLGWGFAYVTFLRKLSAKVKPNNPWPSINNDHILNVFLNIQEYYAESPEETKKQFTRDESRRELIYYARLLESSVAVYSVMYKAKMSQLEYIAVKSIDEYKDLVLATGAKPGELLNKMSEQQEPFFRKQHASDILVSEFGSKSKRPSEILTMVGWGE